MEWSFVLWVVAAFLGVWMVYLLIRGTFFVVHESTATIVERFGRFVRVARPGLRMKIPFVDRVAAVESLKVRAFQAEVETKTNDQAFVKIPVTVQFQVESSRVQDAHYLVENPVKVILDLVSDFLRGQVPGMTIDQLFQGKFGLADDIFDRLRAKMQSYGYEVRAVLITDLMLDDRTRQAMQMRFAAQRQREAAVDLAEAEKTKLVKAAEAEAQARFLEGQGVARQRRVIAKGLRATLASLGDPSKVDPNLVTQLMVMSQYFDSLEKIGGQGKVIFLPHGPGGVRELESQLRNAILQANEASSGDSAAST
jgi:regulator of protease activity HflC (stomatin/prohibitin superfamily)